MPIEADLGLRLLQNVAKGFGKTDSAASDIDLMIVSDTLVYADVFPAIEELSDKLGRQIQPTLYSNDELARRISSDNSLIKRVLKQPKLWIIGNEI